MKEKGKTHFHYLYRDQDGQRIPESKFHEAEWAIKVNQKGFRLQREQWAKKKDDLIPAFASTVIANVAAETKASSVEHRVVEILARLIEAEKLVKCVEQWFSTGTNQRIARPLRTRWAAGGGCPGSPEDSIG